MRKTTLFQDGFIFIAITAMIFIGALVREVNLLILLASLLTCFLIVDFFVGKKTLRQLKIQRFIPTNIFAGETFHMTIELTNERARLSSWMLVVEDRIERIDQENAHLFLLTRDPNGKTPDQQRDSIHSQLFESKDNFVKTGKTQSKTVHSRFRLKKTPAKDICRPVCLCERLKSGETEKCIYAGRLPLRGRYRLGPTRILTSFPFGFFRSSVILGEEKEFAVFPKLGRLQKDWFRRYQQLNERQKQSFLRQTRTSEEPLGIRHWQSGDVRKMIHWRASAKHQELLVRQFEERQNQQIVIIVDLFQSVPQTFEAVENVELAVSFVATLVKELVHGSFSKIVFGVSGIDEIISGKTSVSLSYSVMQLLTDVQTTSTDCLADMIQKISLLIDSNSTILLITTQPFNPQSSNRLSTLQNDPRLRRLLPKITVIDVSDPSFDYLILNG